MMRADIRQRALAFLLDVQRLTPDEAEEALLVAAEVLGKALSRLAEATAAGDEKACGEAAHGLKGNLLNLGLPELVEAAAQAVARTRRGDTLAATAACQALARTLEPLLGGRRPH